MTEFKVGDVVTWAQDSEFWQGGKAKVIALKSEQFGPTFIDVEVLEPVPNNPENSKVGSVIAVYASELKLVTETRTTSVTGAEKGVKPARFGLIPTEALTKVAEHYGKGAEKYAAHNWRKGYEWSKSYDALQRHANAFWQGEDNDPEFGTPHMAAVAFHALTLLTFMDEQQSFDDRFKPEEAAK